MEGKFADIFIFFGAIYCDILRFRLFGFYFSQPLAFRLFRKPSLFQCVADTLLSKNITDGPSVPHKRVECKAFFAEPESTTDNPDVTDSLLLRGAE